MKITLLIPRADVNKSYNVGDEVDVSEAEGLRLIAAGHAVAAEVVAPRENTRKKRVAEKRD